MFRLLCLDRLFFETILNFKEISTFPSNALALHGKVTLPMQPKPTKKPTHAWEIIFSPFLNNIRDAAFGNGKHDQLPRTADRAPGS